MTASPLERLAGDVAVPIDAHEDVARVVVSGAGPTGLCTAIELARRGVPVTVLEKGAGLATESRASTFHPATLELLDALDLAEPVIDRGLIAATTQFRDRSTGPVATFDLGVLSDATRFPFRVQLEQNKFTELARALIDDAYPEMIDLRFEHRVHRAAQRSDGVELLVGTATGYTEITAPWVVAADGAHSPIRSSLGIPLVGETYPERFLVISIADDLDELLADLSAVNYVADPDEWMVLLRTPDHWRVLFPIAGDGDESDLLDPSALQGRLDTVADAAGPWQVLDASLYVVSRCVAATMRDRRVLLAGDSAHQNSPLGGMGMNSGIQDGVSLARRLADVWNGAADDTTLDEYDRLRRAMATGYVQADSHANWLALRERDPQRRAALQDELRADERDPARHRARMARSAMLDAVRDSL